MRKTHLILAAAVLSVGTAAIADVRIDARVINQQRQVDAGKRSGKLSLGERQTLTNEIRGIRRTVERYENSGGRFTDREKATVRTLLARNQAHIDRLKNNRRRGPDSVPF